MTLKEKAEELVDKFYQTTPNEAFINEPYGIATEYKAWEQAKQCALIAVDEIIEAGKDVDEFANAYWYKVKEEINKL